MTEIKISIILPIYNGEKYIKDCLHSILNQTHTNWELIIINDASVDRSYEIACSFTDPRIIVINNEKNLRIAACLNRGIELSTGEFIARIDADDIMFPDRLRKQLEYFNQHHDTDVLGTYAIVIDENNQILGLKYAELVGSRLELIQKGYCFIHPSIMAKRIWFEQNKYNTEIKRAEDLELWFRTFEFSNFCVIKEPLIFYRSLPNIPRWKYKNAYDDYLSILKLNNTNFCLLVILPTLIKVKLKYYLYPLLTILGLLNPIQKINTELNNIYLNTLKNAFAEIDK